MPTPQQSPCAPPPYTPPAGWNPTPGSYNPHDPLGPLAGRGRGVYLPHYPFPQLPNSQLTSPIARSAMMAENARLQAMSAYSQAQYPFPNSPVGPYPFAISPVGMPMSPSRVMYRQPGELMTFPHNPESAGQGWRQPGELMFVGYNPPGAVQAPGPMGNSVFIGYNSPIGIRGSFRGPPTPASTITSPGPGRPASNTQSRNRAMAGRIERRPRRRPLWVLTEMTKIKAGTGMCDQCGEDNAEDVWRCKPCGYQECGACTRKSGYCGSHSDRGQLHFSSPQLKERLRKKNTNLAAEAEQPEPKSEPILKPNPKAQSQMAAEAEPSRLQGRGGTPAAAADSAAMLDDTSSLTAGKGGSSSDQSSESDGVLSGAEALFSICLDAIASAGDGHGKSHPQ